MCALNHYVKFFHTVKSLRGEKKNKPLFRKISARKFHKIVHPIKMFNKLVTSNVLVYRN